MNSKQSKNMGDQHKLTVKDYGQEAFLWCKTILKSTLPNSLGNVKHKIYIPIPL